MKILIISTKNNSELFQELKREYITETFSTRIESLLSELCEEFNLNPNIVFTSGLLQELQSSSIFTINKILLDNIYKYIALKNMNEFMTLINNNTFSKDIYVNIFYVIQVRDIILKYFNFDEIQKETLEHILSVKIKHIIDYFYTNNSKFVNPILLNVFNMLYDNLGYIDAKYYKFELDQFNRPIFIFNARDEYAPIYNR